VSPKLADENLSAILFNCVFVDGYFELCKKLGIVGMRWPECSAKVKYDEFLSLVKEKTVVAARYAFAESIDYVDGASGLPKDSAGLTSIFDSSSTVLFAREMGLRIKADPTQFHHLLKEYVALAAASDFAEVKSIEAMTSDFILETERRIAENTFEVKIPKWEVLSSLIGGFNPGRVTILTAGTGVGKTNLAMALARGLWRSERPSLYINMEMDQYDLTARFIMAEAGVQRYELGNQNYVQKIETTVRDVMRLSGNLHFTSGKSLDLSRIEILANECKDKSKIEFLFVDYDQKIIHESRDDEWKFIQKACEALEELAKRLQLHVVILSQADEESGKPKASKRMMQAASTVLFFHQTEENGFILKALKNRHGRHGFELKINYEPEKSSLSEGELVDQILPKPKPEIRSHFY
jgi:KaiC/GvpD/RAD55 family RecA-like ATPase